MEDSRMIISTLILCLLVYVAGDVAEFDIQKTDDGFSISITGIEVIRHTRETPALLVGKSTIRFTEKLGNFDIEELEEEKSPCVSYELVYNEDTAFLSFATPRGEKIKLSVNADETHPLVLEFVEVPASYNRIWLRIHAELTEKVYGGGEQFTYFNLRGRNYPIWVREQGAGRDSRLPIAYLADTFHAKGAGGAYHTTYYPQTTFVSSRRFYVHVEGFNYAHMDFRNDNYHELVFQDAPQRILFNRGNPRELVSKLSGYLKRQPTLPDWVGEGVILGIQGGTQTMLEYLQTARNAGLPVNGLWIQDWSGSIFTSFGKRVFWNWEWSPEKYPDLDKVIPRLKEEGVRVLAYINSHFSDAGPIFKEADKLGYFVKNSTGHTYIQDYGEFSCGSVDLTNPNAFKWMKELMIKNLVELGMGGWMADFGEYLPTDAVYHSGADPVRMHNEFPVLWAKLNYEVLQETGKLGEIMFFMRAGGPGSSEYSTMMWAGDQDVDWTYSDGLATTVPAALSFAMSGIGMTHFDIGGYTTVFREETQGSLHVRLNVTRSKELFFRSAETAMFTPVMRTHEGNVPSVNYQIINDPEGLKEFAKLVSLFVKLKPYRKLVEEEYHSEGIPMQRPLFLHYDTDPYTYVIQYQYMFGRDVIVAPVIDEGKTECSVYLPADEWVHIFTGEEFPGRQWVTVPAPLGVPTAFYRKSSTFSMLFKSLQFHGHCDLETCP